MFKHEAQRPSPDDFRGLFSGIPISLLLIVMSDTVFHGLFSHLQPLYPSWLRYTSIEISNTGGLLLSLFIS